MKLCALSRQCMMEAHHGMGEAVIVRYVMMYRS